MKPQPESRVPGPVKLHTDTEGVYHDRARLSYAVVGVYVFLIIVCVVILPKSGLGYDALLAIVVLFAFFLVRYLSTSYSLDDTHLRAWRIAGSRRIRLETVRRIEFASMRELSPTGFIGSWGWRGRMWSPSFGQFDAVYTDPAKGLMVTGEGVPVYITPVDLDEFARELSRRVRSYTGRLSVDVGDPNPEPPHESA
ncbi:MAG TPA: PH domain-containing protein [Thermoplasmata archaeon]|nr:PH domain-containing protein [Thermoplasmata archaeon]